mmetsp:Transcript_78017/g.221195  ORF Transcript_78017/g.221195 Transcript_78017/m.221195 type:complete len:208 (+) Transcript_78017:473-1096(+)
MPWPAERRRGAARRADSRRRRGAAGRDHQAPRAARPARRLRHLRGPDGRTLAPPRLHGRHRGGRHADARGHDAQDPRHPRHRRRVPRAARRGPRPAAPDPGARGGRSRSAGSGVGGLVAGIGGARGARADRDAGAPAPRRPHGHPPLRRPRDLREVPALARHGQGALRRGRRPAGAEGPDGLPGAGGRPGQLRGLLGAARARGGPRG